MCSGLIFVDAFASNSSHPFFFLIKTSGLTCVFKYSNAPSKIIFISFELIASLVLLITFANSFVKSKIFVLFLE